MTDAKKSLNISSDDVRDLLNLQRFKNTDFSSAVRTLVREAIGGKKAIAEGKHDAIPEIGLIEHVTDYTLFDLSPILLSPSPVIIFHEDFKTLFSRSTHTLALYGRFIDKRSTTFVFPYSFHKNRLELPTELIFFLHTFILTLRKRGISDETLFLHGVDSRYVNPHDLTIVSDEEAFATVNHMGSSTNLAFRYRPIESYGHVPYDVLKTLITFEKSDRGWRDLTSFIKDAIAKNPDMIADLGFPKGNLRTRDRSDRVLGKK